MRVITAKNVHDAFPLALSMLKEHGQTRDSRNGLVRVVPFPVSTVYLRPNQRVIRWPERDANPFLHLYESIWMLAGRQDLDPLLKFTKNFADFSDDGVTLAGAYGYRWRYAFEAADQLKVIAGRLFKNPNDRRCVLQMWHSDYDLGADSKDVPCNLVVTFQRDSQGKLDMTVFCRSNDIIWGTYGANAVHFSMLQEYMALAIGCPIGTYTQVSVNWHAYTNNIPKLLEYIPSFYDRGIPILRMHGVHLTLNSLDDDIREILAEVDRNFVDFKKITTIGLNTSWKHIVLCVLYAHHLWRSLTAPERYTEPIKFLKVLPRFDWIVAAEEWIYRRYAKWEMKMKMN